MKRIAVTLLFVSLVFFTPETGALSAASPAEFCFDESTAFYLDECPVVLSIGENPGISAGALNILYDHTKVYLSRYEIDSLFSADIYSVNDNSYGQIRFVFLRSDGILSDKGGIIKLFFRPVEQEDCESEITAAKTSVSLYDASYEPLSFEVIPGRVSFFSLPFAVRASSGYKIDFSRGIISGVNPKTARDDFAANLTGDYEIFGGDTYVRTNDRLVSGGNEFFISVKGDLDGDGLASVTDYIILRLNILGLSGLDTVGFSAADIDGNGAVGVSDYIYLRLYILGLFDFS